MVVIGGLTIHALPLLELLAQVVGLVRAPVVHPGLSGGVGLAEPLPFGHLLGELTVLELGDPRLIGITILALGGGSLGAGGVWLAGWRLGARVVTLDPSREASLGFV